MKTITFAIDDELADKAESIYNGIGLTTELALRLFLQRTVASGEMPFNPMSPLVSPMEHLKAEATPTRFKNKAEQPMRTNRAITQNMASKVWEVFLSQDKYLDTKDAANAVSEETGMNAGSAFIYLVILDNLVSGKPNTRNMKMADLEYYMGKIKEDLGEASFENACKSLHNSIDYWDKVSFGNFAAHVKRYLREVEG